MKSILITGGTGYFGQGFVAHLLKHSLAERICIYSRGEFNQALMRKKFHDDERLRFFVGDVRDASRLTWACQSVDTVIHAAALKRVEVGEYCPDEMVKTNVIGAMNVIEAARKQDVQKVIFLSTDKACSPLNAYGASKLMAEKLFLAANNSRGAHGPIFSVTRYGNVAGSTGSVIPTWRGLMNFLPINERPWAYEVPVTDPDATRFWMSLQEAVDLVLWTHGHMHGGELVVPSLPAYRVGDLVDAMGLTAKVTHLGAGEKMHEMMISEQEAHRFQRVVPEYWAAGWPEIGKITASSGEVGNWFEYRVGSFTSAGARRMTVEEIKQRLGEIE